MPPPAKSNKITPHHCRRAIPPGGLAQSMNRLFTPQLQEACKNYPLYSQDDKGKNAICVAIFALGSIRWYIIEGEQEGDDFTMFGIAIGLIEDEYGYVSLNELSEIVVDLSDINVRLQVRQQENFKPTPLKNIQDIRLQRFLARFDKD